MRKAYLSLLLLSLLLLAALPARQAQPATAEDLLAEVNALRAQNGLPPYQANPILMAVAQAHASYMAATGNVTHYSADGSRPFQRALAAGYPVAGDLSLGGFFSENIVAGQGLTPAEAVRIWTGDAPHLNTMLADHLTEAGVGMAVSGGVIYYVLDAARPASGAVAYTPPVDPTTGAAVTLAPPVVPVLATNTPAPDGRVTHIVQPGQTLWTIAAVYEVPLETLQALNDLPANGWVYPGQEILIHPGAAPPSPTRTPGSVTSTPSPAPSVTPSPMAAAAVPLTPTASPTPAPSPTTSVPPRRDVSLPSPLLILVAAAAIATFVTIGIRRK